MKENAALRQETQASYQKLKQEDLGSEYRIQELEGRANMSEQQGTHILRVSDGKLREAAQHVDEQKGKTKLSEDQASHFVKIYNEQGEEAKKKLREHERVRNQLSAAVGKLENQLRYEEESAAINKSRGEEINHAASAEVAVPDDGQLYSFR